MRKKLTSILTAVAMAVVLIPAPKAKATNSVIYYTVMLECQCWCVAGEWTKYCGDSQLYGWGVPPAPNSGEPSQCYKTYITYGDSCDL